MRILAPLSRVEEVEVLSRCGADEFYTGIMPREWVETFSSSIWTNRRGPVTANFEKESDFKEAVRIAHELGKEIFLAFNAPYYTARQMDVIVPIIRRITEDADPDGLIVSDIGMMLTLRDNRIEKPIVVSTLAVAHNIESIRFFQEIGARRVILPRQLSISEISSAPRSSASAR